MKFKRVLKIFTVVFALSFLAVSGCTLYGLPWITACVMYGNQNEWKSAPVTEEVRLTYAKKLQTQLQESSKDEYKEILNRCMISPFTEMTESMFDQGSKVNSAGSLSDRAEKLMQMSVQPEQDKTMFADHGLVLFFPVEVKKCNYLANFLMTAGYYRLKQGHVEQGMNLFSCAQAIGFSLQRGAGDDRTLTLTYNGYLILKKGHFLLRKLIENTPVTDELKVRITQYLDQENQYEPGFKRMLRYEQEAVVKVLNRPYALNKTFIGLSDFLTGTDTVNDYNRIMDDLVDLASKGGSEDARVREIQNGIRGSCNVLLSWVVPSVITVRDVVIEIAKERNSIAGLLQ